MFIMMDTHKLQGVRVIVKILKIILRVKILYGIMDGYMNFIVSGWARMWNGMESATVPIRSVSCPYRVGIRPYRVRMGPYGVRIGPVSGRYRSVNAHIGSARVRIGLYKGRSRSVSARHITISEKI